MRRREFIALLGAALACSMIMGTRAGAQQLAPQHGSTSPSTPPPQVPPPPVPQVTPQLNVPGPQIVPSPPGNPAQQLAPLGRTNATVNTGRIRRHGSTRSRRAHRRHSK